MFCIGKESTLTKALLFSLILIFFLLCLASFLLHGTETLLGSLTEFDNDDVKYLRSAWTFLETGRYTYNYPEQDTAFIMPGLTTVLSGFVAVFGKYPLFPFRLFQALLGCFSLYVIFLIGRRLFSSAVGLVTVFFSVIYLPHIYVTHLMLMEQLFSTLFVLFFLVCLEGLLTKKIRFFAWGGGLLALMVLFRPTVILFPLVIFVMWLILKHPLKELFRPALLVMTIVLSALSPWMIRNAVLFHEFIPFTAASGNPMLQGTYLNYDQNVPEEETFDYASLIRLEGKLDIASYGKNELVNNDVETWIAKYRMRHIMPKAPLTYLKWYTVGKTVKNFQYPFLWYPLFHLNRAYELANYTHWFYLTFALLGLLCLLLQKKMKGILWLPPLALLYFNVVYLPFFCFSRYMFPVMFLVMLFAAYFLCLLFQKSYGYLSRRFTYLFGSR